MEANLAHTPGDNQMLSDIDLPDKYIHVNPESIQHLNVNHCNLYRLKITPTCSLADVVRGITTFSASHNKLCALHGIEQFTSLQELILSHNNFKMIDAHELCLLSSLPFLRSLDLSHDYLSVFDLDVKKDKLSNASSINVSNNSGATRRSTESLHRNTMQVYNNVNGSNYVHLSSSKSGNANTSNNNNNNNVNNNNVNNSCNSIAGNDLLEANAHCLFQLTSLNLAHNELMKLPDVRAAPELKWLNLGYNNINCITDVLVKLPLVHLEVILLQYNKLPTLASLISLSALCETLQEVWLYGNPFMRHEGTGATSSKATHVHTGNNNNNGCKNSITSNNNSSNSHPKQNNNSPTVATTNNNNNNTATNITRRSVSAEHDEADTLVLSQSDLLQEQHLYQHREKSNNMEKPFGTNTLTANEYFYWWRPFVLWLVPMLRAIDTVAFTFAEYTLVKSLFRERGKLSLKLVELLNVKRSGELYVYLHNECGHLRGTDNIHDVIRNLCEQDKSTNDENSLNNTTTSTNATTTTTTITANITSNNNTHSAYDNNSNGSITNYNNNNNNTKYAKSNDTHTKKKEPILLYNAAPETSNVASITNVHEPSTHNVVHGANTLNKMSSSFSNIALNQRSPPSLQFGLSSLYSVSMMGDEVNSSATTTTLKKFEEEMKLHRKMIKVLWLERLNKVSKAAVILQKYIRGALTRMHLNSAIREKCKVFERKLRNATNEQRQASVITTMQRAKYNNEAVLSQSSPLTSHNVARNNIKPLEERESRKESYFNQQSNHHHYHQEYQEEEEEEERQYEKELVMREKDIVNKEVNLYSPSDEQPCRALNQDTSCSMQSVLETMRMLQEVMSDMWSNLDVFRAVVHREQRKATVCIQRYYRRYRGRQELLRRRKEYNNYVHSLSPYVCLMQKMGRGFMARRAFAKQTNAEREKCELKAKVYSLESQMQVLQSVITELLHREQCRHNSEEHYNEENEEPEHELEEEEESNKELVTQPICVQKQKLTFVPRGRHSATIKK